MGKLSNLIVEVEGPIDFLSDKENRDQREREGDGSIFGPCIAGEDDEGKDEAAGTKENPRDNEHGNRRDQCGEKGEENEISGSVFFFENRAE